MTCKIDGYCGMACDILLEDQMKILQHCIVHSDYDAEFAPIMVQRLIDQAEEVKNKLEVRRDMKKQSDGIALVSIETP